MTPPTKRMAVFAYGSLVDPRSAAQTLGRHVPDPVPARLRDWSRRWSICRDNFRAEKTFATEPGGAIPPWIIGLNIERAVTAAGPQTGDGGKKASLQQPNGALVEVTPAELERLDLRELRYDRVEVTSGVEGSGVDSFDAVFAFTAKPENHAPAPPPGAVIVAAYLRTVEAAFAALGPDEAAAFAATTPLPPGVPVVDVRLVRDEIPDGNPRGW